MATYFIGDLQGCFDALVLLLERIRFDPARDQLRFTGDLVNRGGQDLATLRFMLAHEECVETVLGNHDLHLLATAAGLRRPKRSDTFGEVLEAEDRETLLAWLRHRPLLLRHEDLLLIHAGLLPEWDLTEAEALARILEARIRGGELAALVASPGQSPRDRPTLPWREAGEVDEDQRHGLALDAFVALRFLDEAGAQDRHCTEAPEDAPAGLTPWYSAEGRRSAGAHLVHGHWASLGLRLEPRLWSLDGGCVWGGTLCAIRQEDQAVFEVRRPG